MAVRKVPISQWASDEVGIAIYDQGVLADSDGNLVTLGIVRDPSTQIVAPGTPAEREDVGLYKFRLLSAHTAVQGGHTVTWDYDMGGQDYDFTTTFLVNDPAPNWDSLDALARSMAENVYFRVSDGFDSSLNDGGGGPYLWELPQSNFGYETIARLMRTEAITYINFAKPKAFIPPFTIGSDGTKPFPQDWYGLLERSTYYSLLKHLQRSYLEQPLAVGVTTARLDRRDYYDRWGYLAQLEKQELDRAAAHVQAHPTVRRQDEGDAPCRRVLPDQLPRPGATALALCDRALLGGNVAVIPPASSAFPTSLDDFAIVSALDLRNNPSLAKYVTELGRAVEALEAKVGANNSGVGTSLDYVLKRGTGGHAHTGVDGAGTKVAYPNLSGIPTTFAPSSHTHASHTGIGPDDHHLRKETAQQLDFRGCGLSKPGTQAIPNENDTIITWSGTYYDQGGYADLANDRIHIPLAGWYRIEARVGFDSDNVGRRRAQLQKEGNPVDSDNNDAVNGGPTYLHVWWEGLCSVNANFRVAAWQDSGTAWGSLRPRASSPPTSWGTDGDHRRL